MDQHFLKNSSDNHWQQCFSHWPTMVTAGHPKPSHDPILLGRRSHYAICCWYHHSHYVDQYKYICIHIYNLAMAYMYIYIYKIWLWLQTHDSAQWGFKKTPIDPITPSVCSGKAHGSPPPPEIWRFCQPRRSPVAESPESSRKFGVTPWQLESCSNCVSKIHKHKSNLKQNDKVFFKTVPLCLYNYGLSMVLWGRCEGSSGSYPIPPSDSHGAAPIWAPAPCQRLRRPIRLSCSWGFAVSPWNQFFV